MTRSARSLKASFAKFAGNGLGRGGKPDDGDRGVGGGGRGKAELHGEAEADGQNEREEGKAGPGLELFGEELDEQDEDEQNGGEDEAVGDEDVGAQWRLDDGDGIEGGGVVLHSTDLEAEVDDVPVAADGEEGDEDQELEESEDDSLDQGRLRAKYGWEVV